MKRSIGIFIIATVFQTAASGQEPTAPEAPVPEATDIVASEPPPLLRMYPVVDDIGSSTEQGRVPMLDAFDMDGRKWRLEKRQDAIRDTQFKFNFRTMYFDRNKFDDSQSQAWAAGGWAGMKTGYFLDRISFGVTGYTSQKIYGDEDKGGTGMLKPGQDGLTVLGEAYIDFLMFENHHLFVGRKEYDTPFINRNDTRMIPSTFEAASLQGSTTFGNDGGTLKYGIGYFDAIKEKDSDRFVSMSIDAGAPVERGVVSGGASYQKDSFSIGAIDYYSPDIINIFYTEAKSDLPFTMPFGEDLKPRMALQFVDQRSVGSELLQGGFSGQQVGVKAELPTKNMLFTVGYTLAAGGSNLQSPWGGYPGYTSVQVEDFNRAGEGALLLRAAYNVPWIEGVSAYVLYVNGSSPNASDQYRKDELDFNIQYAPTENFLKGLSLRIRYAMVNEYGPVKRELEDFRVICNYEVKF